MNRRDALFLVGALPIGATGQSASEPEVAPGSPDSAERMALIEAFEKKTAGLAQRFEARVHKPIDGWSMPYRLFRPEAAGRLPLVLYLHGAGGVGSDNRRQIEGDNVFGTHLWALAETQRQHRATSWRRRPTAAGSATMHHPRPARGVSRQVSDRERPSRWTSWTRCGVSLRSTIVAFT
jgi:hypothetical protein